MRITRRGRIVIVFALLAWATAFATGSRTATMAAGILTLAITHSLLTLPRPRVLVERAIPRERFTEGETFEEKVELTLASQGRVVAHVVEHATAGLAAQGDARFDCVLEPKKPLQRTLTWTAETWGLKRLGPLQVTVRGAHGLFEADVATKAERTLRVIPAIKPLGKYAPRARYPEPALGAHSVTRPGDGFEFFALREYAPGDSIRRINWKASARATNTMVNQVTRDSFARVLVIVDLREKERYGRDTPPWVRNGRAAAAILAHHERMRDHLGVIAVTSRPHLLSTSTNPRAGALLEALADIVPDGDLSLEDVLRENLGLIRPRAPVYFLTSGTLDPSLGEAFRLVTALEARPVWIAPAVVDPGEADGLWRRLGETRTENIARSRSLGVTAIDWSPERELEVALLE